MAEGVDYTICWVMSNFDAWLARCSNGDTKHKDRIKINSYPEITVSYYTLTAHRKSICWKSLTELNNFSEQHRIQVYKAIQQYLSHRKYFRATTLEHCILLKLLTSRQHCRWTPLG
ncbi:hypothetical protein LENED_000670 [Lentinula edodes]|uniref:Uncharacterized protein n=1 Tax=Lentinula edodes TaxID=5353 RepID=A0A1Q3DW57_LENED|nr:hypothetical protein LENED_000670 [Lentinula edodes]